MIVMMTVAETRSFEATAKGVLSEDEVAKVITMVAEDPECGDLIKGTGGVRKVRIPAKGKGKSGGARVVYYFHNEQIPVYLLTVFAKGDKDNLTKAERNQLAKVVKVIVEAYRKR